MAFGHDEDCICTACVMAELDGIAAERGITWRAGETAGTVASQRTRYATPDQACGTGVVRHVSPRQVAFIKRLLAERDIAGR